MCGMRDGFDEKEQRRDQRGRQETRSAITNRQHTSLHPVLIRQPVAGYKSFFSVRLISCTKRCHIDLKSKYSLLIIVTS